MFEGRFSPDHAIRFASETSLNHLLDELLMATPGHWMCEILDGLAEEVCTDGQREKLFLCWERQVAWTQAKRAEAMVLATDSQSRVHGPIREYDDFAGDLVAHLTGNTLDGAGRELETARALTTHLVGCRSALEMGQISWQMAKEVALATEKLEPWQREEVDQHMVSSWDVRNDLTAWRRKLRRAVLKVDEDAEGRREQAKKERRVELWKLPDGMAAIHAEMPAEDAITVMAGLTALADAAKRDEPDDDRTLGQLRADALRDIFASALADPTLPKRQGRRPEIQATGGIQTLLGLRDNPGELAGYGPITAAHLREIAADGEWLRFCTAPDTGALIAVGTTTYRPNAALRQFMTSALPTCDFPGCSIPSRRCDGDHSRNYDPTNFDHGGATDRHNVKPRCRRHHRCKTHADWTVEVEPDGNTIWTSPGGFQRIIPPYRLAGDDELPPPDHESLADGMGPHDVRTEHVSCGPVALNRWQLGQVLRTD